MATIAASAGRRRTAPDASLFAHLDLALLTLPIAISALGLLMIFDASRHETGLQVFGELVIPAELEQVESRQRKAPSYEMGRRTRPFRRSVRR